MEHIDDADLVKCYMMTEVDGSRQKECRGGLGGMMLRRI